MDSIISVKNISKDFILGNSFRKKDSIRAVNDVSFSLYKGKGLAIVGESGSGKSTIARIISRIYNYSEGEIFFQGKPFNYFKNKKNLAQYRKSVQMIFQDPFGSLNPIHTIYHHIERPLKIHNKRKLKDTDIKDEVYNILNQVGLLPEKSIAKKYPHELSGGQRQRVNIARTIAVDAEVILADEPTSMLDVSIRAGVLNLIESLKIKNNMALLYITHDIATARYLAESISVMYVGHMVEWGDTDEVLQNPKHPYTRLLVSAIPDPKKSIHVKLESSKKGEILLWKKSSKGCPFFQRCPEAKAKCQEATPPLSKISDNHYIRCFLYE